MRRNTQLLMEAADEKTAPERLAILARCASLKRSIALNPATPPYVLETLSRSTSQLVRKAVAGNPNTPMPCLWKLAKEFADEVLTNPVLPLLMLDQPTCFQSIDDEESILQLLGSEHIPPYWLAYFSTAKRWNKTAIQQAAQMHVHSEQTDEDCLSSFPFPSPVFPVEHIEAFLTHPSSTIRQWIASHVVLPENLEQLAKDPDERVRSAVATNRNTPEKVYLPLADDPSPMVRSAVACRRELPLQVFSLLLDDKKELVRYAVASNPNVPESALSKMAGDSEIHVRGAVARHPRTPEKTLAILAKDPVLAVRQELLHRALPQEILLLLAKDHEIDTMKLLDKYRLPGEALRSLASHPQEAVRLRVAYHFQTPDDVLLRLASDEQASIRGKIAWSHLPPPRRLVQDARWLIRLAVAEHPLLGEDDLVILLSDPHETIRLLAQQRKQEREEGSDRAFLSETSLKNLRKERYKALIKSWKNDPYAVRQLLETLTHQRVQQEVMHQMFSFWHNKSNRMTRLYWQHLFTHPSMPRGWLCFFASSSFWEERYLVAAHPSTSSLVLEKLTRDGNRFVRAAARYWLSERHTASVLSVE